MIDYLLCCVDLIVHAIQKPSTRWVVLASVPVLVAVGLLVPMLFYILLSQVFFLLLMTYLRPLWIVEFMHWTNLRKNNFTTKYQTVGDFTFCYAEKGTPTANHPTLVFFHGLSATKDMWFPMPTAIPEDRHVILLDMPGHGDSTQRLDYSYSFMDQASRIAQFFIAIDLQPFHLVGISMGGGVAAAYAGLHPKNVVTLSLLCPAGFTDWDKSDFMQDSKKGLLLTDSTGRLINHKEMQKAIPYLFHVHEGYKVAKMYSWIAFEVLKTKKVIHGKVTKDLEEEVNSKILLEYIPKIEAPTQVIWGKYDRLVHPSGADILKAALPDCEVQILERCGHTISYDRPFKAMKLILEFGRKTQAAKS